MDESTVLRIGILQGLAPPSYQGSIGGKTVEVPKLSGRALEHPKRFLLEECFIPERGERVALLDSRCHFTLDAYPSRTGAKYFVALVAHTILQPKNGKPYIRAMNWRTKYWSSESLPSIEEVVAGIGEIIQKLKQAELEEWLSRMQPPA